MSFAHMTRVLRSPDDGSSTGAAAAAPAAVAPGTAASAPAATAAPATGDWISGLQEEARGYVQIKGWKKPDEILDSYRNLEKMHGTPPERLIKLPAKDDDAEGWGSVYSKLGRPEKADGYKLDIPAGGDESFATWAKETFHEAGLNTKQAEKLAAKWNAYVSGSQTKVTEDYNAKVTADSTALKKEWGAAHDQNINVAKVAAKAFGMDDQTIDKLESALGFSGTMKFFHNLGSRLGEGTFVTGSNNAPGFKGALTPDQANAEIAALKADTGFVKRFVANDSEARSRMDQLHKWANPE
jgi:hypothetical protein